MPGLPVGSSVSRAAVAPGGALVTRMGFIDPTVIQAFNTVLVETDEGKVVTGMVVRETKTELVLRDAEDLDRAFLDIFAALFEIPAYKSLRLRKDRLEFFGHFYRF